LHIVAAPALPLPPEQQDFIVSPVPAAFVQQPLTQHLSVQLAPAAQFSLHPHFSPHAQSVQQHVAFTVFPVCGVSAENAENGMMETTATSIAATPKEMKDDRFIEGILVI